MKHVAVRWAVGLVWVQQKRTQVGNGGGVGLPMVTKSPISGSGWIDSLKVKLR